MNESFLKELKKEKVGEVIKADAKLEVWTLKIDGVIQEYTHEYLEHNSDMYLGDDLEYVYRQVEEVVCANCNSEGVFYDKDQEEYFCPMCESEE